MAWLWLGVAGILSGCVAHPLPGETEELWRARRKVAVKVAGDDPDLRRAVYRLFDSPGLETLDRYLGQERHGFHPDRRERRIAPTLVGFLGHPDPVFRAALLCSLGVLGDKSVAPDLAPCLEDPDPAVQREAVFALGRLGDIRVKERLTAYATGPDDGMRVVAMSVLAKLRDPSAAPLFLAALREQAQDVRLSAVDALIELGDPAYARRLVALLKDPDLSIQLRVVQGLGLLGDRSVVPDLAGCLDADPDREPFKRELASLALGKLVGGTWVKDFPPMAFAFDIDEGVGAFLHAWFGDAMREDVAAARAWWARHRSDPAFAPAPPIR